MKSILWFPCFNAEKNESRRLSCLSSQPEHDSEAEVPEILLSDSPFIPKYSKQVNRNHWQMKCRRNKQRWFVFAWLLLQTMHIWKLASKPCLCRNPKWCVAGVLAAWCTPTCVERASASEGAAAAFYVSPSPGSDPGSRVFSSQGPLDNLQWLDFNSITDSFSATARL
jgi:hypothetical protein